MARGEPSDRASLQSVAGEAVPEDATVAWARSSDARWARVQQAQAGWKALFIVAFMLALAGLAHWSGRGAEVDIPRSASLTVFAAVAAALAVFAFGPALFERLGARADALTGLGRFFYLIAAPVLWTDRFLLRGLVGRAVGLRARKALIRYPLLFVHVGLAAALVWVVPRYWADGQWVGYVGLGWAFVALLAVVRTWIWIEGQYARRVDGFDSGDVGRFPQLRDEALLCVLLFVLSAPVVLWRLDASFGLFAPPPDRAVEAFDWVALFGSELMKAIPLVDWAEVYDVGADRALNPAGSSGLLAIFVTRIVVDVMLIGALIYTIGRVGEIARQWREFIAGRRTLLDPSLEQRVFNVLHANAKAAKGSWLDVEPPTDIGPFARYNAERLRALAREENDPRVIAIVLHAAFAQERAAGRVGSPGACFTPVAQDALFPARKRGLSAEPVLGLALVLLGRVGDAAARDLLEDVMSEFEGLPAPINWRIRVMAADTLARGGWLDLAEDERTLERRSDVVARLSRGLARNCGRMGDTRRAIADQLVEIGGGAALEAISEHLENERAPNVLASLAADMTTMKDTAPPDQMRRAAERARRRAARLMSGRRPSVTDQAAHTALVRVADHLDAAAAAGSARSQADAPPPGPPEATDGASSETAVGRSESDDRAGPRAAPERAPAARARAETELV